ncbi:hypothetical protein BAE44_0017222 [Dichanthelium oligosanthes]|uniref:Protein kinase domain-containing protein n=1 Tax=Dichanthelium oligosanthes TaxID=888268 RepID=A0A1E5V9D3_9POAL|nr:hypothetical protein BAE44_0017222 [Dichanthelium oligosanthes]
MTSIQGDLIRAIRTAPCEVVVPDGPGHQIKYPTVEDFLRKVAEFTRNYPTQLGAGGFGKVYRGALPNGLVVVDEQEKQCKELLERMCKVAFWCVLRQPEVRPTMSMVVNMLEGHVEIPPPVYPF